jgi:hypothetical protein
MLYVAFCLCRLSPQCSPAVGGKSEFMIIVYRFYYVYDNILFCRTKTWLRRVKGKQNPSSPISRQSPRFHSCDFQISISFMSQKCQNLLPLKSIASRKRRSRRRIEASGPDNTRSTHYGEKRRKKHRRSGKTSSSVMTRVFFASIRCVVTVRGALHAIVEILIALLRRHSSRGDAKVSLLRPGSVTGCLPRCWLSFTFLSFSRVTRAEW